MAPPWRRGGHLVARGTRANGALKVSAGSPSKRAMSCEMTTEWFRPARGNEQGRSTEKKASMNSIKWLPFPAKRDATVAQCNDWLKTTQRQGRADCCCSKITPNCNCPLQPSQCGNYAAARHSVNFRRPSFRPLKFYFCTVLQLLQGGPKEHAACDKPVPTRNTHFLSHPRIAGEQCGLWSTYRRRQLHTWLHTGERRTPVCARELALFLFFFLLSSHRVGRLLAC